MRLLHVDQAIETRLDEDREIADHDGLVVGSRAVDEHRLDLAPPLGQPDARLRVESAGGFVGPAQDVPGPI